ncbi:hypothetical protein P4V02_00075 [Bacillus subtilis]|uniref:hypothetical protein n=1 Tax=Bacillus subtilis TaxID=1423 RepID=UPI001FFA3B5A|nr:hypothetical protein [Bacillus subtilis]MED1803146.1 hypothetical protein [Bacillus subtilis]UPG83536.1 hypothetical protein MX663_10440 [Bacillus subtilis]WFA93905.1 hypothetical protein LFL98_09410 [Bacillus subtilis]
MKKKKTLLALTAFISLSTFSLSASAASTTGSVTSYKSQNAAQSIQLTGAGKYMKLTCTYTGSSGGTGYCDVYEVGGSGSANLTVSSTNKTASTDVWMNKGKTYILQADDEWYSPAGSYVTATIKER